MCEMRTRPIQLPRAVRNWSENCLPRILITTFCKGYLYYERSDAGEEYVKHCRRKQNRQNGGQEPKEETLLDCVELAKEVDFLAIGRVYLEMGGGTEKKETDRPAYTNRDTSKKRLIEETRPC